MNSFFFSSPFLDEVQRLNRRMSAMVEGLPASIRAGRSNVFPQINIGSTDDSVELIAFAPGIDPATLDSIWFPDSVLNLNLNFQADIQVRSEAAF